MPMITYAHPPLGSHGASERVWGRSIRSSAPLGGFPLRIHLEGKGDLVARPVMCASRRLSGIYDIDNNPIAIVAWYSRGHRHP
jgi:hypothetical protein